MSSITPLYGRGNIGLSSHEVEVKPRIIRDAVRFTEQMSQRHQSFFPLFLGRALHMSLVYFVMMRLRVHVCFWAGGWFSPLTHKKESCANLRQPTYLRKIMPLFPPSIPDPPQNLLLAAKLVGVCFSEWEYAFFPCFVAPKRWLVTHVATNRATVTNFWAYPCARSGVLLEFWLLSSSPISFYNRLCACVPPC